MSATRAITSLVRTPLTASTSVSGSARDACITAIALTFIALFLLTFSFILFGIGSMDPTQNMGLGAFGYMGGTFLSFTALGIILGAVGFGAYSFSENQKICPFSANSGYVRNSSA